MKIYTLLIAAAFFVLQNDRIVVRVEEVYVVVDANLINGDPINGLMVEDFAIKQNGITVPIRGLEITNQEVSREGPVAVPLVLCNKGCLTLDKLRQAASKFLTLFKKDDLVAMYLMCPDPHQIAEFTNDFKELQKVLWQVQIITGCKLRLEDTVTMATNDVVALKTEKDHRRVMTMISGDNIPFSHITVEKPGNEPEIESVFEGPDLDRLVNLLTGNDIKFFDISHNNRPQTDLAKRTGGQSINVETLVGSDASDAVAALKTLRLKNVSAHRYIISFSPVIIGELGTITVALSPRYGTLGKDYSLVVQKPIVKSK